MKNMNIEGSPKTPRINFDCELGVLELYGRSIPENSVEFFEPLNEWLDEYSKEAKVETIINVKLEYFNTSSSKCILDLFKKLESINGSVTSVKVNWFYEKDDEDMAEAGEDYEAIVDLPFNLIEVEEI